MEAPGQVGELQAIGHLCSETSLCTPGGVIPLAPSSPPIPGSPEAPSGNSEPHMLTQFLRSWQRLGRPLPVGCGAEVLECLSVVTVAAALCRELYSRDQLALQNVT